MTKNIFKNKQKNTLTLTLAAALLFAAVTLLFSACHNQPQPENTEDSITDTQTLADLEAQLATAKQDYADAMKQADSAQAIAGQKAAIAKKKGTKQAKTDAEEAQKQADQLKADADEKGERVKQLEMEISQLKMKLSGEEETSAEQAPAITADNGNTANQNTENASAKKANSAQAEAQIAKDFEAILNQWKNGKNSTQKANQFCTGALGIKIANKDSYATIEQHFNSLDNNQKNDLVEQMRNFKFTGDKE